MSRRLLQGLADDVHDLVDVLFLHDQRGRQGQRGVGVAAVQALGEAAVPDVFAARAGDGAVGRGDLHSTHQAHVADVHDVRQALQGVQLGLPVLGKLRGVLKHVLLLEDLQGGEARSHRQRVTTVLLNDAKSEQTLRKMTQNKTRMNSANIK